MHLFVTVVVSAFIIALFEWCILHANRIFLNFNWIFDWLYTSVLVLWVCACMRTCYSYSKNLSAMCAHINKYFIVANVY